MRTPMTRCLRRRCARWTSGSLRARRRPPHWFSTRRAPASASTGSAQRRPHTSEEFLEVNGVGANKLERYGARFLAAINEFSD